MPELSPPLSFPAARLHLHGIVERRIDFPDFAGSALRGAFGHALRRAACVTGQPECRSCPLYRRCAYPAIFATPPPANARHNPANVPPPYVIEPPAPGPLSRRPGQPFGFGMVLIGAAIGRLPLIARSVQHGLTDIGRGSVRLQRISSETGTVLAEPDHGAAIAVPRLPDLSVPAAPDGMRTATLAFSTPFLLARNGRAILPADLTARDILMALVRRVAELSLIHAGQPLQADFSALAELASQAALEADLRDIRFARHSSRLQRSMPMRGNLGTLTLRGELAPFWPFLYLCQWLHMGKKCVFGFGRYTLRT